MSEPFDFAGLRSRIQGENGLFDQFLVFAQIVFEALSTKIVKFDIVAIVLADSLDETSNTRGAACSCAYNKKPKARDRSAHAGR